MAEANAQGYRASQQYAYSPTSNSNATVQAAALNNGGICSTIMKLCTDTAYAVKGMPGAIVATARAQNDRAGSGAWNAGAYFFASGTSTTPAAPSALTATVQ